MWQNPPLNYTKELHMRVRISYSVEVGKTIRLALGWYYFGLNKPAGEAVEADRVTLKHHFEHYGASSPYTIEILNDYISRIEIEKRGIRICAACLSQCWRCGTPVAGLKCYCGAPRVRLGRQQYKDACHHCGKRLS